MKINKLWIGLAGLVILLTSCENQEISHPDFEYQTVYFANQYPARTVELGDDLYVDNSMDNQHRVVIKATMGGVYHNNRDIVIDFVVDTSLCNGIYFNKGATSGSKVVPMPSNYYQLASNQIIIPAGSILGGVEVQLTDDFFADPLSLVNTYVIPLRLTNVQGADSILQGKPLVDNPNRCVDAHWSVKPQDFVFYTIKYINQWAGNYLRRGTDQITKADGSVTSSVRHKQYVENDEVVKITTNSLTASTLSLTIKNDAGVNVPFNLLLTFSDDGNCTISSSTVGVNISGTGKFALKGEKNSFGGFDRNVLYLDYSANFTNLNLQYATKDTLVVRDRGIAPEYLGVIKM